MTISQEELNQILGLFNECRAGLAEDFSGSKLHKREILADFQRRIAGITVEEII